MFSFLEQHYQRGPSDEFGGLLGSLSLLEDGQPADAALADDWIAAVVRASDGIVDASLRLNNT